MGFWGKALDRRKSAEFSTLELITRCRLLGVLRHTLFKGNQRSVGSFLIQNLGAPPGGIQLGSESPLQIRPYRNENDWRFGRFLSVAILRNFRFTWLDESNENHWENGNIWNKNSFLEIISKLEFINDQF